MATNGRSGGKRSGRTTKLSQTSVFYQNGLKICELPMVVKKVNDVLQISGMDTYDYGGLTPEKPLEKKVEEQEEETEVMAGFSRCFSAQGVYRLLETVLNSSVDSILRMTL